MMPIFPAISDFLLVPKQRRGTNAFDLKAEGTKASPQGREGVDQDQFIGTRWGRSTWATKLGARQRGREDRAGRES